MLVQERCTEQDGRQYRDASWRQGDAQHLRTRRRGLQEEEEEAEREVEEEEKLEEEEEAK